MIGNARAIVKWLMEENSTEKVYECKEHKRRRSLDANGFYWSLLTKLADSLRISKPRLHNQMLRSYGQPEFIEGKLVPVTIQDTEEAENKALEAETFHIKPTSQVREDKDGKTYRTYYLLRGSSSYNTKEFSTLLDGLIEEAKEQGIETIPPAELAKMYVEMEKREKRKSEKVNYH